MTNNSKPFLYCKQIKINFLKMIKDNFLTVIHTSEKEFHCLKDSRDAHLFSGFKK